MHAILQEAGDKARAIVDLLQTKEEEMWNNLSLIKGRQILWTINEHFRTNSVTDAVYDVIDLANLQYPGDKNMTTFMNLWDSCVASMEPRLPDDTLMNILAKKLKSSQALKEDLAHFHRCEPGHEHRTYQWLRSRMDSYLVRHQQEKNQDEKTDMFKSGGTNPRKAAPGKGDKGGGKGNPRAKSKARAKSAGGGGSSGGGGGAVDPERWKKCCYYHQSGSCNKGRDCKFEHIIVSKAEYAKMKPPGGARSRTQSPGGGKGSGDGRQRRRKGQVLRLEEALV